MRQGDFMKKLYILLILFLTFGLTSCSTSSNSEVVKNDILTLIDFYITYNEIINDQHDRSLDDVEESVIYDKTDFFNYDEKDINNVELEYDEAYVAFTQLLFVKEAVEEIDKIQFETYFEEIITTETLYLEELENGLFIDFYEVVTDLEVIIRHSYKLETINEDVYMEKYLEIYDIDTEESILMKRFIVEKGVSLTTLEYFPTTSSFLYIENDYQEQTFFLYKGTMLDEDTFIRQTIEYYIDEFSAYVSFDIKEDKLEDYRVKFFEDGHRVVKVDINVKNSNPTVNELTWNLLSIDGWDKLENISNDLYLYQGSTEILTDYDLSIQLDGYGKINAYKMFEGEIQEEDITLSEYGLDSGYTLAQVNAVKQYFIDHYESELNSYGFILNEPFNRFRVLEKVEDELSTTYFNIYIAKQE
jgi:hypothetical protein